jgi:hypothetical protein
LRARPPSPDFRGKILNANRQGDKLGTQTVKKFTLLNTVSKVPAAARSFDAAGSVAVALSFTDHKTALMRIGIP